MTIILTEGKEKVKKLKAQIKDLQKDLTEVGSKHWAFFDDMWVDPKPYQASLTYGHEKSVMVHRLSPRRIDITMRVKTLKEAVEFANNFTRAPIDKVTDGSTVGHLPSEVLDYSYENPGRTITRTRFGTAMVTTFGGAQFHSNKLKFFVVKDNTPESLYVGVEVEVKDTFMSGHANYPGHTWSCHGAPTNSISVFGNTVAPKYNAHGEVIDGNYTYYKALPAGGDLNSWCA